jgi:hypothetical protein
MRRCLPTRGFLLLIPSSTSSSICFRRITTLCFHGICADNRSAVPGLGATGLTRLFISLISD